MIRKSKKRQSPNEEMNERAHHSEGRIGCEHGRRTSRKQYTDIDRLSILLALHGVEHNRFPLIEFFFYIRSPKLLLIIRSSNATNECSEQEFLIQVPYQSPRDKALDELIV